MRAWVYVCVYVSMHVYLYVRTYMYTYVWRLDPSSVYTCVCVQPRAVRTLMFASCMYMSCVRACMHDDSIRALSPHLHPAAECTDPICALNACTQAKACVVM